MEPYINLKQIMDIFEDVFGFKQSQIAESFLRINKSQMSNAVKGKRYINRNRLADVFFDSSISVPADNSDNKKHYAKEQIVNHLRGRGILYPDIEEVAEKTYADVVTAILNHYPPDEEKSKDYEDLVEKGSIYYKNGNYAKALDMYRDAEEAYKNTENQVHSDRRKEMKLYTKIAEAFLKLGKYSDALSHYRQALDICEFISGSDHTETAKLYQSVGIVLRKDRFYPESKEMFTKAEDILKKKLDDNPSDPEVANLYNDFGLTHLNEKNYSEALNYYKISSRIREENYKKCGNARENYYAIEYAYSVHNMGTYYNKLVTDPVEELSEEMRREYMQKAAEFHEKAYELRVALLNGEDVVKTVKKDSPLAAVCLDIAQSLTLWASDLVELGEIENALEKCELGLKIREEKHGKGAVIQDIAWSYYTLGLINDKLGDYKKALKCFAESHRIRLKVCNGDHPYAAKALFQMGRMKLVLAHPDALLDLKKAHEIQKRFLKPNDPELMDTAKLIETLE